MPLATGIFLALLAAATQSDALFTNTMPPADVPTFEVTMGDNPPFFAAIQIGGQWLTDHRMDVRPSQTIELVLDSPFYTGAPVSTTMRRITLNYEAPAMRRSRLENAWEEYGFTFVNTAEGWKPITVEDVELAERARAMAANTKTSPAAASPGADAPIPVDAGQGMQPGILIAFRAAIVLAGVLLGTGALMMIYRRDKT